MKFVNIQKCILVLIISFMIFNLNYFNFVYCEITDEKPQFEITISEVETSNEFCALSYNTYGIERLFNTTLDYKNGSRTSVLFGGVDRNRQVRVDSIEVTNVQTKKGIYDILLGFSLSWDYRIVSDCDEFINDLVSKYLPQTELLSFNLSVRMPIQLELDYTDPFFDDSNNTITVQIYPLDWEDFNEFECRLVVGGEEIFDYSNSYTTPFGEENALKYPIGPLYFFFYDMLIADVQVGFQIVPKLFSTYFEAQIDVIGDGELQGDNKLVWSQPEQVNTINVYALSISQEYISIAISEFVIYLNTFLIDFDLIIDFSLLDIYHENVDYTLFTIDASWIPELLPLRFGVHPSSPIHEINLEIPIRQIPFGIIELPSSWYGFTLEIDNDWRPPYLYNFQTDVDGSLKPICVGQDLDPWFTKRYYRGFACWDLSGIPDNYKIKEVSLSLNIQNSPKEIITDYVDKYESKIDFYKIEKNPIIYGRHNPGLNMGEELFYEDYEEKYVQQFVGQNYGRIEIPLGPVAREDIENLLVQDWFTLGFHESFETESEASHEFDRGLWFHGGEHCRLIVRYVLYNLSIESEFSTTNGGGVYDPGSTVTFGILDNSIPIESGVRLVFNGWTCQGSGGYSGKNPSSQIKLNNDVIQIAQWTTQYYLNMSCTSGGYASPPSGWYDAGAVVNLNISPHEDYTFNNWTGIGSGSYSGQESTQQIIMNGPLTQFASFNPITYFLLVKSEFNNTSGGGQYLKGELVSFSIENSSIYVDSYTRHIFTGWTSNSTGGYTGPNREANVFMLNDVYEKANYIKQYYLQIESTSGGTVSQLSGWYDSGSKVTITAISDVGYTFNSWKGTGDASYSGIIEAQQITMFTPIMEIATFSEVKSELGTSIEQETETVQKPNATSESETLSDPSNKNVNKAISGFPYESILIGISMIIILRARTNLTKQRQEALNAR